MLKIYRFIINYYGFFSTFRQVQNYAVIKGFDLLTIYTQSLWVSSSAKYVYEYGYFVL